MLLLESRFARQLSAFFLFSARRQGLLHHSHKKWPPIRRIVMHENARRVAGDLEQHACDDHEHEAPCLVVDSLDDLTDEL